jgi:hypothetical protein
MKSKFIKLGVTSAGKASAGHRRKLIELARFKAVPEGMRGGERAGNA